MITKYYFPSWIHTFIEKGIPLSKKEYITQQRENGRDRKERLNHGSRNEETVSINNPIE